MTQEKSDYIETMTGYFSYLIDCSLGRKLGEQIGNYYRYLGQGKVLSLRRNLASDDEPAERNKSLQNSKTLSLSQTM